MRQNVKAASVVVLVVMAVTFALVALAYSAPVKYVGCTDGRGGVTPIEVSAAATGGDANCHSANPRQRELCANRVCDQWSTGSTAAYWY